MELDPENSTDKVRFLMIFFHKSYNVNPAYTEISKHQQSAADDIFVL
jgi:hypothetical protein